jgi:hypothetical protein
MQGNKLKEQIDRLDPLSAGVVFGKEDAWEKLQGRLDAPPKRKKLPIYWWAAAALLLLVAGITAVVRLPATHAPQYATKQPASLAPATAANQPKGITDDKIAPTTAPVPSPAATAETPVTMKTTITAHKLPTGDVMPIAIAQPEPPQALPPATTPLIDIAVPALAVKPPMKVVHINELNSDGYSTRPPAAATENAATGIVLSNLPVIHINKVLVQEERPYYRAQENKNPINLFTFIKPLHPNKYSAVMSE